MRNLVVNQNEGELHLFCKVTKLNLYISLSGNEIITNSDSFDAPIISCLSKVTRNPTERELFRGTLSFCIAETKSKLSRAISGSRTGEFGMTLNSNEIKVAENVVRTLINKSDISKDEYINDIRPKFRDEIEKEAEKFQLERGSIRKILGLMEYPTIGNVFPDNISIIMGAFDNNLRDFLKLL